MKEEGHQTLGSQPISPLDPVFLGSVPCASGTRYGRGREGDGPDGECRQAGCIACVRARQCLYVCMYVYTEVYPPLFDRQHTCVPRPRCAGPYVYSHVECLPNRARPIRMCGSGFRTLISDDNLASYTRGLLGFGYHRIAQGLLYVYMYVFFYVCISVSQWQCRRSPHGNNFLDMG